MNNKQPENLSDLLSDLSQEDIKFLVSALRNRRKKSNKSSPKSIKKNLTVKKTGSASSNLKSVKGQIKIENYRDLSSIISQFFKESVKISEAEEDIRAAAAVFNHLVLNRGLTEGTKRFRKERQYVLRWLLGLPNETVEVLGLQKDGFPSKYRFLKERIFENSFNADHRIKYVNTILSVSRLTSEAEKSLKSLPSITKPFNISDELIHEIKSFKEDLPDILRNIGVNIGNDRLNLELSSSVTTNGVPSTHLSNQAGPNNNITFKGKLLRGNATITAHVDAHAVINDREVFNNIKKYSKLTNNQKLVDYMESLSNLPESSSWNSKPICSRIAVLEQPENKRRTVAIVDYWTQSLLLPLHKYLQQVALKVPCSYYEDQDRGRELCRQFTLDQNADPVSYDATDFTDRFPRLIQEAVLSVLFDEELAKSAIKLMACRNFRAPYGKNIRYAVGQPMGSYGSFSLAHLTHCLYAMWKCESFGDKPNSDVAVVGDDIAWRSKSLACEQYLIGMDLLGVPFNKFKGFESTPDNKIVEFCKRLYVNGSDQSALSPRVLRKSTKDFKCLPMLDQYLSRGQVAEFLQLDIFKKNKAFLEKLYLLPSEITGIKNNLNFEDSVGFEDSTNEFISKLRSVSDIAKISINEFVGTLYVKALIAYTNAVQLDLFQRSGVDTENCASQNFIFWDTSGAQPDNILRTVNNKLAVAASTLPSYHPIKVIPKDLYCRTEDAFLEMQFTRYEDNHTPSIASINWSNPMDCLYQSDVETVKSELRLKVTDPQVLFNKDSWSEALYALAKAVIMAIEDSKISDKRVETTINLLPKGKGIVVGVEMESQIPDLQEGPQRLNVEDLLLGRSESEKTDQEG